MQPKIMFPDFCAATRYRYNTIQYVDELSRNSCAIPVLLCVCTLHYDECRSACPLSVPPRQSLSVSRQISNWLLYTWFTSTTPDQRARLLTADLFPLFGMGGTSVPHACAGFALLCPPPLGGVWCLVLLVACVQAPGGSAGAGHGRRLRARGPPGQVFSGRGRRQD